MIKKAIMTNAQARKLPPHNPLSKASCTSHATGVPGVFLEKFPTGTTTGRFSMTRKRKKYSEKLGTFDGQNLPEMIERALKIRADIEQASMPEHLRKKTQFAISFEEFAEMAMEHRRTKNRSANDDDSKLRIHVLPVFAHRPLNGIGQREYELLLSKIEQDTSPAFSNRVRSLLSVLYNLAQKWGYSDQNPIHGITKYRENNVKTDHLSPEQLARVIEASKRDTNVIAASAVQFLAYTGVRLMEALKARWSDVDMTNRTLLIRNTKAGIDRHVVLNDKAMGVLEFLKTIQSGNFVFSGKNPDKHYVNVTKPFGRYLKEAGLGHMRVHSLRHTHASLLIGQGASLFQVQKILGHSTPAMTMRYSHLSDNTLRDVSQLINKAMQSTAEMTNR